MLAEADGSDYWTASREILCYIAENENATVAKGWNDFELNVKEYRGPLKESLPIKLIRFYTINSGVPKTVSQKKQKRESIFEKNPV